MTAKSLSPAWCAFGAFAPVALGLLSACGGSTSEAGQAEGSSAQPLGRVSTFRSAPPTIVSAPNQAWIFDGSANADAAFIVALTDAGFLAESAPPTGCDSAPSTGPVRVVSAAARGVSQPSPVDFNFDADILAEAPVVPAGPFDPGAIPNDCVAGTNLAATDGYLAQSLAQATQIQGDLEACLKQAKALHCQVVNLPPPPPPPPDPFAVAAACFSAGDELPGAELADFLPCRVCSMQLATVPGRMEMLEFALSTCQAAITELRTDLTGASCALSDSENALGMAEEAEDLGATEFGFLADAQTACAPESVEASCRSCSPQLETNTLGAPVSALVPQNSLRISRAFLTAAVRASDPGVRARLLDLAIRMATLPERRVLRIVYQTDSLLSRELIGLTAPGPPDHGLLPPGPPDLGASLLAVDLVALGRDTSAPSEIDASPDRLLEGIRAFRSILHVSTPTTVTSGGGATGGQTTGR